VADIVAETYLLTEAAKAPRQSEDRELIADAIAGDAEAFALLYESYLDRIYRHIHYRVSNPSDAEDLTQRVFMQAWSAIGRYRQTNSPFLAWLFTIAHNLTVSFYRSAKSQYYLEHEVVNQGREISPESAAETGEREIAVRRAILRLKPQQQQVVMLRFIENLSHAEVAAALGKSEAAVRVVQHRALHELRQILGTEDVNWP
jgi:RNA polymerase sigma-70 factor (ECF subfamily)